MLRKRFVLFVLFIFMLSGCSKSQEPTIDPVILYNHAVEKQETMTQIDVELEVFYPNISLFEEMTSMGVNHLTMDMKFASFDPAKPDAIKGYYKVIADGMTLSIYVNEGFMYLDLAGLKAKTPLDLSEIDMPDVDFAEDMLVDASDLSQFTIDAQQDHITYTLFLKNKDEVAAFTGELSDLLDADMLEVPTEANVETVKVVYEIDIDSQTFTKVSIEVGVSDSKTDESGIVKVLMKMNSSEDVVIDFPNFDEYEVTP